MSIIINTVMRSESNAFNPQAHLRQWDETSKHLWSDYFVYLIFRLGGGNSFAIWRRGVPMNLLLLLMEG